MSLLGLYDRYREPTTARRLWQALAASLMAVAAISSKNQDVEPFGL